MKIIPASQSRAPTPPNPTSSTRRALAAGRRRVSKTAFPASSKTQWQESTTSFLLYHCGLDVLLRLSLLLFLCCRVKDRVVRVPPGYQAELVIQLLWVDGEPPQQISSVDINSAYGL